MSYTLGTSCHKNYYSQRLCVIDADLFLVLVIYRQYNHKCRRQSYWYSTVTDGLQVFLCCTCLVHHAIKSTTQRFCTTDADLFLVLVIYRQYNQKCRRQSYSAVTYGLQVFFLCRTCLVHHDVKTTTQREILRNWCWLVSCISDIVSI